MNSGNNHDDDSVTTFGLRSTCKSINLLEDDSDDDAESAPPRRQKEPKLSPFVSPATQTLNVLSQNMDDLRYNMMSSKNDLEDEEEKQVHEEKKKNAKKKSSNLNHNTTTDSTSRKEPRSSLSTKLAGEKTSSSALNRTTQPTNTIEPAAQSHATTRKTNSTMISSPKTTTKHASTSHDIMNWWEGCKADWQLIPISIKETDGVLGMVLQNSSCPATKGKHCKVLRVYQPSLAQRNGVQAGDWICRLEGGVPVLALLHQVTEWSKQRPFHIHILRAKQPRDEEPSPLVGNNKTFPSRDASNADGTSCASDAAAKKVPSKNVVDVSHDDADESKVDHHYDDSSISVASVSTTKRASSALLLLSKRPKNKSSASWNSQQEKSSNKEHQTSSQPSGKLSRKRDSNGRSIVPREKPNNGSSTAKKTPPPPPSSSNRENTKSNDNDPFCRRCNPKKKKMPRMHHAWCRLNQFFENSGAMDLMKRIRQGVRLGCQACETEFSTGKLANKKHLGACNTNQKRLKKLIEAQERLEEEEEKRKKRKGSKPSPKKKDNGSRQKRKQPDIVLSPSSSDDEEDEGMDEVSVYQPKRKRGRIKTNSVGQASLGRGSSKPRTSDTSRATRPKDSQEKDSPTMVTPQPPTESATGDQGGREAIKPNWITCSDNPWGSEGYTIGDVLLYGPQLGLGHFETVLPSERYVMDPFALSSTYRTTHCTPQEGLAFLSVRRDTLATRPWGFRVGLDEFGHGCLVESVAPMSPAVAATFVGMPENSENSSAGLNVNDMIVMVNGKTVGGMTRVGLDLEVETSGPVLLLAVSRYKHAEDAARKFAAMERQMIQVMDSAARDDRLIGWHEVGNADSPPSPAAPCQPADSSTIGDSQQDETNDCGFVHTNPYDSDDSCQAEESASAPHGETLDSVLEEQEAIASSSLIAQRIPVHELGFVDRGERGYSSGSEPEGSRDFRTPAKKDSNDDNDSSSEVWEKDDNAWLGCVCGIIHRKAGRSQGIFWIQCEACRSWYDVSKKCVGFDVKAAETVENWTCWACPESESLKTPKSGKIRKSRDSPIAVAQHQKAKGRVSPDEEERIAHPSRESKAKIPLSAELKETSTNTDCVLVQTETGGNSKESPALRESSSSVSARTKNEWHARWKGKNREHLQDRRTPEGFLLPKSQPIQKDDGAFSHPCGPRPAKMTWDYHRGVWVPHSHCGDNKTKQNRAASATESAAASPRIGNRDIEESNSTQMSSVHSARSRRPNCSVGQGEISSISQDTKLVFEKGNLVYVKPHAWPGKNCTGGVGHVVETFMDEDGDRLYCVKYVIGATERDIEAEYVSPYSFH